MQVWTSMTESPAQPFRVQPRSWLHHGVSGRSLSPDRRRAWLERIAPNCRRCDFVTRERSEQGGRRVALGLMRRATGRQPGVRYWFAVNAHAYGGLKASPMCWPRSVTGRGAPGGRGGDLSRGHSARRAAARWRRRPSCSCWMGHTSARAHAAGLRVETGLVPRSGLWRAALVREQRLRIQRAGDDLDPEGLRGQPFRLARLGRRWTWKGSGSAMRGDHPGQPDGPGD